MPDEQPAVSASKANELRKDKYSQQIDSKKLNALVVGYSQSNFTTYSHFLLNFMIFI